MSKYTPSLKDQLASAGSVPTMLVPETGKIPITTKLTVDNSSGPAEIEAPKKVEYLKEPVHTLKFTDTAGFGSSRIAALDDAATASGYIQGWIDQPDDENEQFKDYSGGMYEQYHPDVFPKKLAAEMTLDENTKVYPDGTPLKSSFIRKRDGSAVQYGMEENIKIHNKRIKTAAKAALMLYRCSSTEDLVTEEYKEKYRNDHPNATDEEINQAFIAEANVELDNNSQLMDDKFREADEKIHFMERVKNEYPDMNIDDNDIKRVEEKRNRYEDFSGDFQNAKSISKGLDEATFDAIATMSTSEMDLPESLNAHQKKADYGMWGKYYEPALGFHRGIDICNGTNIYSICSGTVVDWKSSGLTILIIEIDNPIAFKGQFLTYMHGNFNQYELNQRIALGEIIGTESDNGVPGKFHTHIELNDLHYAKCLNMPIYTEREIENYPPSAPSKLVSQFTQARWENGNREELYSTAPYEFIEACFQNFWDAIRFANSTYKKISKS